MSAEATKTTRTRTITQEVEEEVVTLVLSLEQAQALYAVTRHIGGPPTRTDGTASIRGILTDQIGDALHRAVGPVHMDGPNTDALAGREKAFTGMYIPAEKRVVVGSRHGW